jgi:hypothetical protein
MTDPGATRDPFHRHPHLTTVGAAALVGFVVAVVAFAGSGVAAVCLGTVAVTAVLAALAEAMSARLGRPLVPRLLTGDGMDSFKGVGRTGWIDAGGWGDAGGGGGGDGGGGG